MKTRLCTRDPFELLEGLNAITVFSDAYRRDGLRGYCAMLNRLPYVVINAKQREEEQRVVAAHEAGHLILHEETLRKQVFRDKNVYDSTSICEREANLFAADFLMDDEEVLSLLREEGADADGVAKQMGVPTAFFAFKLFSMIERGYRMNMVPDLNSRCLK